MTTTTLKPLTHRARLSRRAIGSSLLIIAGLAVTWPAWADMMHIAATDEESSHIFLVPLVAAWLVYVRRARFRYLRPDGRWIGPLLIGLGWFMHGMGDARLIQSFWHAGAVLVVVGCFLTAVGGDVLRKFLPAFVVLVFLVPVPGLVRQQIALPLQTTTAQMTQMAFELMGADVQRSGNVLTVGGVEIWIAEACNGLRMVFTLLLVTYAFAFGASLRGYIRLLVLASTPVLAILANMIRMIPTVWVYGHWPDASADLFHDAAGWAMVPLTFLMLMAIIGVLRWALVPVTRFTLAHD